MENKFEQSYRSVKDAVQSESDSSDSDSGDDHVWKRKSSRKRAMATSPVKSMDTKLPSSTEEDTSHTLKKRKLNTVWCNVLEEQTVADDLVQFGLKTKPVSYQDRSCESYDFRLSASDPRRKEEESAMDDDILCIDDVDDLTTLDSDPNESSGQKSNSQRRWPKSAHESKDVVDNVAKKIIRVLNEPKHHMIYKVVHILGSEKALKYLQETETIEDNGGMFVLDNSRRRTPGGTFLQLIKKDKSISNKKKSLIFDEDRKMLKRPFHHSRRKKRGKNILESMDIVCERNDDKDVEVAVELKDAEATVELEEATVQLEDAEATVEQKETEEVNERNGRSDGASGIDVHDIEGNSRAKEDSELEEGEVTD